MSKSLQSPFAVASGADEMHGGASAAPMIAHPLRRSNPPIGDPAPDRREAALGVAASKDSARPLRQLASVPGEATTIRRKTVDHVAPPLLAAAATRASGHAATSSGSPPPRVRAVAVPAVASAGGVLIWRTADDLVRDVGRGGLAMGPGAEGRPNASAETEPSQAASPSRPDAPAWAALQPVPDMSRLADEVMRLVVRRIHVERERRGGKLWS
jgi:hypothetical protein